MKIVVTLLALAPMVFRMAMSRCFSITSRISDATMFSAATMTMSPIVSEMATFSSQSAEKSDWFMSAQSCAIQPVPSLSLMASAVSGARNTSSRRSWMASISSLSSRRFATSSDTNPVWESIS